MRVFFTLIAVIYFTATPDKSISQNNTDSVLQNASLINCVQYALQHQPTIQQSLIDEDIVDKSIKSKLADWYPQLNLNYTIQNYFQLPSAFFGGNVVQTGAFNNSGLGVSLTQNLFTRDLLLANRTAGDVRKQIKQSSVSNKIDVTVNVSKAFYDVLLTQKQISVLDEDIIRLEKSLKDAYNQYQSGIVDKTDYKRATISLNNAKAQRKQVQDLIVAKYAYLKQLMGYPDKADLVLQYDSNVMEREALIDTAQQVSFQNRIEYQLLQTQQKLQQANVQYNKWSYIPTVSAFGAYNSSYFNNSFGKLYNSTYTNSFVGLQLSMPIFQGNKRVYQVKQAELQLKRVDWDMISLKSRINAQYEQAMASYKGNLANFTALKDNVQLADEVYKTIHVQYTSGIKTYLDVIIAESDLRTAQLNYYTALYQLLESKIDVQKALGNIQY
ncbi:outer membrane protein TolC precursor [mine drainage metagenome]|uniref:Outer membrane protein TolC n=1 Tax=mine drainage metagenome TaxID=410659 RepID=A0A1J5RNT4_9ZZZZ